MISYTIYNDTARHSLGLSFFFNLCTSLLGLNTPLFLFQFRTIQGTFTSWTTSGRAKRGSNSFKGPAEATVITTLNSVDNFIEFRMRNATKREEKDKKEEV